MNVLLIVVDCLRYDYVTREHMPFLTRFGAQNNFAKNFWAASHCTDPSMTYLLSGKHPDDLGLYTMLFEHKNYSIPKDVEMLAQTAKKNGFYTASITNIGRWYQRGVDHFVDCRGWNGARIFGYAGKVVRQISEIPTKPYFLMVHTDDMHTNYTGGTYETAAGYVDEYIRTLLGFVDMETTNIYITADHGEGLGQNGIVQHGHGLFDFLTHVPLVYRLSSGERDDPDFLSRSLMDHGSLYWQMRRDITGQLWQDPTTMLKDYVFQVGDTPPNRRHRAILSYLGTHLIHEYVDGEFTRDWTFYYRTESEATNMDVLFGVWRVYAQKHGFELHHEDMSAVEERLKGLGYFG